MTETKKGVTRVGSKETEIKGTKIHGEQVKGTKIVTQSKPPATKIEIKEQ